MMLKAGLLALIATTAMATAAMADCRIMAFRFYVTQNDSVSTTGVSTGGGACTTRIQSLSTVQYTSGTIVSRPSNGVLSEIGPYRFRYKPKVGFKGVDRYTIRICGKGLSGSGCSTITHTITVQ
jgi:hypothetical protein